MPAKLKFQWKEIQHGIYSCHVPGPQKWHLGCLVWYRHVQAYYFHHADIEAELVGCWTSLDAAKAAVERLMQDKIVEGK